MLMLKVKILAREQGRVGQMQIRKFRIRNKYESKYTNKPREKQRTKRSEKQIIKRLGSLIKRTRN